MRNLEYKKFLKSLKEAGAIFFDKDYNEFYNPFPVPLKELFCKLLENKVIILYEQSTDYAHIVHIEDNNIVVFTFINQKSNLHFKDEVKEAIEYLNKLNKLKDEYNKNVINELIEQLKE